MPHHVYAAKRKVLSSHGRPAAVREVSASSAIAPYGFALRSQLALDLAER